MGRGNQDSSRVTLDGLFEGIRTVESGAVRRPRRIVVDGGVIIDQLSYDTDLPSSFGGEPARVIDGAVFHEEIWAKDGVISRPMDEGPAIVRSSNNPKAMHWDWVEDGRFAEGLSFNSAEVLEDDNAVYFSKFEGRLEDLRAREIALSESREMSVENDEPNHFVLSSDGTVARVQWFDKKALLRWRRNSNGGRLPSAVEYGPDGLADCVEYGRSYSAYDWAAKVPTRISFGPRDHPREGSLLISWRVDKDGASVTASVRKDGKVVIHTPRSVQKMAGHLEEVSGITFLKIKDPLDGRSIHRMKLPEFDEFAPDKFLSEETIRRARDWANQIS